MASNICDAVGATQAGLLKSSFCAKYLSSDVSDEKRLWCLAQIIWLATIAVSSIGQCSGRC